MQKAFSFALVALLVLLTACSSVPRVKSVQDGIAVGYLTVESIAEATYVAHQQGSISDELKDEIRVDLQDAKHQLDQARALLGLDLGQSQDALTAAESILVALQQILQENLE